jgi:hypothetical protein
MKILKMPNPIQHLRQTQANFTQHSVQTRPTTLDENFKQYTKPNPTSLPNPSQYYATFIMLDENFKQSQTQPTSLPNPSQYYPTQCLIDATTTLDENFKQCQTQSNIFAKSKPIIIIQRSV